MKRPTRVIRGSLRILNITPSEASLSFSISALRCSASTYIERNLITSKLLFPRPARGWRKKTGPRDSSLIAIASAIITGEKTVISVSEPSTSSDALGRDRGRGEAWGSRSRAAAGRRPGRGRGRRRGTRRGGGRRRSRRRRRGRRGSTRSSCSWLALEKAMITRSICCASMIVSRSEKRPSQGRSGVPASCTSSSTRPTGTSPNWRVVVKLLDNLAGDEAGAEDQRPLAQLRGPVQAGADDRAGDAGQQRLCRPTVMNVSATTLAERQRRRRCRRAAR